MDGATAAEQLRKAIGAVQGRSPLYERLLAGLAGAAERGFDGGVIGRLLSVRGPTSRLEARLLLLAALHDAALRDPQLPHAAWYPTARPDRWRPADEGAPGALALAYLVEHETDVAEWMSTHHVQTNEVGRCAALLPGFLAAGAAGLPLRLLEVGCSAGLNLRFDRYRYRYLGGPGWGPSGGPTLEASAEGAVPAALVPPTVEVIERRGVDLHPIDPTDPDGARLLHAFAWADEHDRHQHLRDAVRVAASNPARLDTGDLLAWTEEVARPVPGVVTVLFHSQVTYMLDDGAVTRFEAMVERALRSAMPAAPFFYLRLEPPRGMPAAFPELVVAQSDGTGPPRTESVLTADWHGRWVRWW